MSRVKDDSPTLVKINIFNRVADAIEDMVMYDNINEKDIELLKKYPEITRRIIDRKYEDLDKSINKIKEDKKGKLIPIMNKAKIVLRKLEEDLVNVHKDSNNVSSISIAYYNRLVKR